MRAAGPRCDRVMLFPVFLVSPDSASPQLEPRPANGQSPRQEGEEDPKPSKSVPEACDMLIRGLV